MNFLNTLVTNDYRIVVTDYFDGEGKLLLNLNDEKITQAIINKDLGLFDALIKAQKAFPQLLAMHVFENFFYRFTQGRGWAYALSITPTKSLMRFKRQAETVLWSDYSTEQHKQEARGFLNALDGDFPEHIPTDSQIKNTKQNRYNSSRAKWLRLLVEERGYKCHCCPSDKNLKIKHLITIQNGGETELSNLELRCTKCINK